MVREVSVKSVLNRHKRRDDWFLDDYSVNPYRSCEFNCVYCYIHGGGYGGACGELAVKVNAPKVLGKELHRRARRGEYGFISLSSATEPWMWIEEKYEVTRRCLRVIANYRFPVHCLTKSTLILRDIDLLKEVDDRAILPHDLKGRLRCGVLVTFSISTLDDGVAGIFEPNAPTPLERLEALSRLREEGLNCGVALIPVLPFISDSVEELEETFRIVRDFSPDYIFVGALTLNGLGRQLYYRVLDRHFPELLPKYRGLFRSSNQPCRGYRMRLEEVARSLCERYNLRYKIL